MKLEDHSWVSADLWRKAEQYTDQIWRERDDYQGIYFIPLEEFNRDGTYYLRESYPHFENSPSGYVWQDGGGVLPFDPGFSDFIREICRAMKDSREFLRAAIVYALAHGMDIVPGTASTSARSVITGTPHWMLHTYNYGDDLV